MKAEILFEALAVLRQIKDLPPLDSPPCISWHRVMSAHNNLEFALMQAGLQVPIEPVKVEA